MLAPDVPGARIVQRRGYRSQGSGGSVAVPLYYGAGAGRGERSRIRRALRTQAMPIIVAGIVAKKPGAYVPSPSCTTAVPSGPMNAPVPNPTSIVPVIRPRRG